MSDLGFNGNGVVRTPNLDRLAAESVHFSDFYVAPVCAPSRASLLTGRHFLKTGVSHVHGGKDFLSRDESTLADELRSRGYRTGMWGKWHLGSTKGYRPWERGFDEAYMARLYEHRNSAGSFNGTDVEHEGWSDDVIVAYAKDFIDRKDGRPFFAYLSFLTCHGPLDAPRNLVATFREYGVPGKLATLYAMIASMDAAIGRLIDHLEARDLMNDTIIVFLSDNGPAYLAGTLTDEERALRFRFADGSVAASLSGMKGDIWENGVRSPLLIQWRGRFETQKIERVVDVSDVFPTILDLVGGKEAVPPLALDGQSLRPHLEGRQWEAPPHLSFLYGPPAWPANGQPWTPRGRLGEYDPVSAVTALSFSEQTLGIRSGAFKLVRNGVAASREGVDVSPIMLFNVVADPGEKEDLANRSDETVSTLQEKLASFWSDVQNSPHAFAAPTFRVSSNSVSTVLAFAPSQLDGNAFVESHDLMLQGQSRLTATYFLDVERAFTGSIQVDWQRADGQAAEMHVGALRTNGERPFSIALSFRQRDSGEAFETVSLPVASKTPIRFRFPAGDVEMRVHVENLTPNAVRLKRFVTSPCGPHDVQCVLPGPERQAH
jgi:uncharacterized sulfatase